MPSEGGFLAGVVAPGILTDLRSRGDIAWIKGEMSQRSAQPPWELVGAVCVVVEVSKRAIQMGFLDDHRLDLRTELLIHQEEIGGREDIGALGYYVALYNMLVEVQAVGR